MPAPPPPPPPRPRPPPPRRNRTEPSQSTSSRISHLNPNPNPGPSHFMDPPSTGQQLEAEQAGSRPVSGITETEAPFLEPFEGADREGVMTAATVEGEAGQEKSQDEERQSAPAAAETPRHPFCRLSNQARELAAACEQTRGPLDDLHKAISLAQEAVEITPPGHHHVGRHLAGLAGHWKTLFERTGALSDHEQSITTAQSGLEATPNSDPARFIYLSNLACCLDLKFVHTDSTAALEQAIACAKEAVPAAEDGHPYRADCLGNLATYLSNLASFLSRRHEQTAESTEDITHAIQHGEAALAATPPGDPVRAERLHSLATYHSARYRRTGVLQDLQLAVQYTEAALTETPPAPLYRRTQYVNTLAVQLVLRHERTGAIPDLQDAIRHAIDAVTSAAPWDPMRDVYLNTLASVLLSGQKSGVPAEVLDAAFELVRGSAPRDTEVRAQRLDGLMRYLATKYQRTGEMQDLQQALSYSQELLDEISPGHPRRAQVVDIRASMLFRRFTQTGDIDGDLSACIEGYHTAWSFEKTPPSTRVEIALRLCNIFHQHPMHAAGSNTLVQRRLAEFLPALCNILETSVLVLLPLVSPRQLRREDQQFNLARISGLAGDAAACVLAAGRSAGDALRLLELSRGVMMGFAIDCRGDLAVLKVVSPQLCERFSRLRAQIDTLESEGSGGGLADSSAQGPATTTPTPREKAIAAMGDTIRQIRSLPGLSRFQLPPTPDELMSLAASGGPIVLFNSTSIRSDALIVTDTTITSLPLPDLHNHEIPVQLGGFAALATGTLKTFGTRNRRMREVLKWLWDVAVGPVVAELGLECVDEEEDQRGVPKTHVWWIGVGVLSTAPFHAAGDYSPGGDTRKNIMRYAVSSYIPTIKALSYAREREFTLLDSSSSATSEPQTKSTTTLLLIAMSKTPHHPNLPNVLEEVSKIASVVEQHHNSSTVFTELLHHPSKSTILAHLQPSAPSCAIVHFACHGISHAADPSNSHLILVNEDGDQDLLTVQDISNMHTGTNSNTAQLAYLSACSTADNPASTLADETIHIASGFQLAGFSHVVGTMWPSQSAVCKEISTEFYRGLFSVGSSSSTGAGGGGHGRVRTAVHTAVRSAQVKYRSSPVKWAPFIHLGA